MSVLEIQKVTGLNRPTLYRLLETLGTHSSMRNSAAFSLDYAVGTLAQSWLFGLDPAAAALPIVERLHEQCGRLNDDPKSTTHVRSGASESSCYGHIVRAPVMATSCSG
jgi:hypothetical protein